MPGEARARGFARFMLKKYGKREALRRSRSRRDSPETESERSFWAKVVRKLERGISVP